MFKTTTCYYVAPTDFLDKVFPSRILPSGFINKGRCAIGGTQMEILNMLRCAIITVPNISIIKSKKAQHPELDVVYGDIDQYDVYDYFINHKQGQKIMTTPEGVRKIMWAAEQTGREDELYADWFFMLDEAHTFISESYREDILAPFEYFWSFKNKCIISATPYYFTDPRMKELDYHEVRLTGKLGEITLVNSLSVAATLDYLLKHIDEFSGNVHIFYNSVTEIAKAIERAGLKDSDICNIYCADDKEHKNLVKLGDLAKLYCEQPDDSNFKKINFYTCKYFEGWDLYDTNATLVLATDVYKGHTKIGIADKGIQAFGRLRGKKGTSEAPKPEQMIHITNSLYNEQMKAHNLIVEEFTYNAKILIEQNNTYVADPKVKVPSKDIRLDKFADIHKETKLAILNTMKLDQQINEASKNEVYNHIKFIKQAWESKYNVDPQFSALKTETSTTTKRKSVAQQFKEDFESIINYRQDKTGSKINWNFGDSIELAIRKSNPLAYDAANLLDPSFVKELKYKPAKVKEELIYKRNELAEVKLLKLLDQHFKIGRYYTNEYITSTLQTIYTKLNIANKNGKIKVAFPAQLGEAGRFEIKDDKKQDSKGKWVHGHTILRKQFGLLVAA